MSALAPLFATYNSLIAGVPAPLQWLVSLGIFVLLLYIFIALIKRSLIFLILLVIFVPASLPLLNNVWQQFMAAINMLAGKG
jgi:hypothetical protein